MSHFYTTWKRQKTYGFLTYGFLTFLGGIKMQQWTKMGWKPLRLQRLQSRFSSLTFFILLANWLNRLLLKPIGKNLSFDESMMLWRRRLIFKQYTKNERSKYGIKFCELITNEGKLLNTLVYSGKSESDDNDLSKIVVHKNITHTQTNLQLSTAGLSMCDFLVDIRH